MYHSQALNDMKNEMKAKDGMWLTQATLENEDERSFWKKVCGYGDLEALFTLYTDEQKAQWEEEHPQEEPIND